ncbi:15983_t:CDS:2 [Funneliformis mosseae]|uniref:15983_t:CDS:1 n=1 Tax=Funneliformis mosseae TaxID=27381 RepID=A0A9N9G8C3_FUNMO|nr:15983_t:CDS:2 [Funneliformis mosseae]
MFKYKKVDSTEVKIISLAYGIGINVNSIIGSGIVTAPGIIWNSVKSPGIVLLLWFIGGLVSMAVPYHMSSLAFMYIFAIRPGITSAVLQSAVQYFWYTISEHQFDMEPNKNGFHLSFSPFWAIKFIAIAILFFITAYHMINNRLANVINQSLAVIKLITYSIIAIVGICRLFLDWETSRLHWQKPLERNTDFTAYTSSMLLLNVIFVDSLNEFKNVEKELFYSNNLLVNIAFISVVPLQDSLNDERLDQTIATTFFNKLFDENETIVRIFTFLIVLSVIGTAASNVWSYWIFYLATGIGLLIIRTREYKKLQNKQRYDSDKEKIISKVWNNKAVDKKKEKLYKVPLFITIIFILSGFYILIFSFVIHVKCPESIAPESIECSKYLTT